jgi:hypothetical protein
LKTSFERVRELANSQVAALLERLQIRVRAFSASAHNVRNYTA